MNLAKYLLRAIAFSLLGASAVHADDLGRLFTSPQERVEIEKLRYGYTPAQPETTMKTVGDEYPPAQPETARIGVARLVLNGTLTGSDGRRLVWINNTRMDPDRPNDALTLLGDGRIMLDWRDGMPAQVLKPGQGLDRSKGEIYETYTRAPAPAPQPDTASDATPETAGTPKTAQPTDEADASPTGTETATNTAAAEATHGN